MKKQIGFTMIELICVISLLSIFAISFNIGFGCYDNIKTKAAASELYEDILMVKNACICGEYWDITIYTNSYKVSNGKAVVKNIKLPEGISIDSNFSSKPINIDFSYIGSPSSSGTMQIKFKGETKYTITIVPCTGRVRLIKGSKFEI